MVARSLGVVGAPSVSCQRSTERSKYGRGLCLGRAVEKAAALRSPAPRMTKIRASSGERDEASIRERETNQESTSVSGSGSGSQPSPSLSSFEGTSPALTALVELLTRVVNFFGNSGEDEKEEEGQAKAVKPITTTAPPLTEDELLQGLKADFEKNQYLWTGKITPELYCQSCTFTDPTLSFSGLETFLKNLENLDPIIRALVREDRKVELRSIELERERQCVIAKWRMVGTLKVPWRPTLDLCGQTSFFYDADEKRVKRYYEQWEESVGNAFKQLIFPK